MTGRTHDLAAISTLAILTIAYPPSSIAISTLIMAIFANMLGGIAPDIDEPTAPFWRNLPIGGLFGKIIAKMLGGHRFISHSALGAGLFGLVFRLILEPIHILLPRMSINLVWLAFMIGFFSHLFMDTFTKEGVPWLLPLPYKFGLPPFRQLRITTGKWIEIGVIFPGIVLFDILFGYRHAETILAVLRKLLSH